MRGAAVLVAAAVVVMASLCAAPARGAGVDAPVVRPAFLVDDPETIYAPLEPPKPNSGVNEGGVRTTINVSYLTDYVFRGVDRGEVGAFGPGEPARDDDIAEDAANLQFDGKLAFDLGRLPHPFVGVFVNVFNDDPVSRFQEVRPYAGLDWNLRPIRVTAGWQAFIFPERDDFNTSEVFARIQLDDATVFRADRPVLSPYVYAAYDYDRWDGVYLEAGVTHDFPVGDTGIVLTAVADVGFALGNGFFTRRAGDDTGFQHYDVGLVGSYPLNGLLNVPRRYGEFKLKGYVFYTDGIERNLRADTQLWGGVGVQFDY